MEELLKAAIRAFNAIAEHYENHPKLPLRDAVSPENLPNTAAVVAKAAEPAAPAKRGRPKAVKAESVSAPVMDADILDTSPPPPLVSETESQKQAEDMARALVQRFSKTIDGKPQGFHLAKKLLAEFGAQRLHDLTHGQRVTFTRLANEILADADKQPMNGIGA